MNTPQTAVQTDVQTMRRAGLLLGTPEPLPAPETEPGPPPSVLQGGLLRWTARAGTLDLYSGGPDGTDPGRLTRLDATQIAALHRGLQHCGCVLHTQQFTLNTLNVHMRESGRLLVHLTLWDSFPEDESNFGGSSVGVWRDLDAQHVHDLQRLTTHLTRRYDVYQPTLPGGELTCTGYLEADPDDLEDAFHRAQHGVPIDLTETDDPEKVGPGVVIAPAWTTRPGCAETGPAVSLSLGDELVAPDGRRWQVLASSWKDVTPHP